MAHTVKRYKRGLIVLSLTVFLVLAYIEYFSDTQFDSLKLFRLDDVNLTDGHTDKDGVLQAEKQQVQTPLPYVQVSDMTTVEREKKVVLFWTKYQTDLWWKPHGGYSKVLPECTYQECIFTANKSDIELADVIAIKEKNMIFQNITWPTYRNPRQLYVHMLTERPVSWQNFIQHYEDKINLTMNYRNSADISIPGRQLYERAPPIPGAYKLRIPLASKERMAVWAVGNCYPQSKRQDYVGELSKYIDVDIYGPCGNFSCPKSSACFEKWERKYKFYLSFENAICDDYITEKYYNPVRYELVPVTLSGNRYNSKEPPHASINVSTFDSPKALARYLMEVASNETKYTAYFQWKQKYEFRRAAEPRICKLCEAAHTIKNKPAHTNYYDWWFGGCDNGLVDRMRKTGRW